MIRVSDILGQTANRFNPESLTLDTSVVSNKVLVNNQ